MRDESRLLVFQRWRILLTVITACMLLVYALSAYVDSSVANPWAWVALGSFALICGLLWTRRLPPPVMWLLMLVANAANSVSSAQTDNITPAVFCGVVACACVWWAWEARSDPSEHVIAKRVAESGEG